MKRQLYVVVLIALALLLGVTGVSEVLASEGQLPINNYFNQVLSDNEKLLGNFSIKDSSMPKGPVLIPEGYVVANVSSLSAPTLYSSSNGIINLSTTAQDFEWSRVGIPMVRQSLLVPPSIARLSRGSQKSLLSLPRDQSLIVLDDSDTITQTIDLLPDWNSIGLPLEPLVPYTAESVCEEVESQGGSIAEVYRWYGGGWQPHICGLPFNNFLLEFGEAYFIRANQASTWTVEGTEIALPLLLELQIGWNAVSLPYSTRAENLCDEVANQGVTSLEIDHWHAGGWSGHVCGLPFNNFLIPAGTGFFIRASSSGMVELGGSP